MGAHHHQYRAQMDSHLNILLHLFYFCFMIAVLFRLGVEELLPQVEELQNNYLDCQQVLQLEVVEEQIHVHQLQDQQSI